MVTKHMAESVSPVIHQTLHGYADGHTLLAASCDLTPAEKKALLLLSDLSGQTGNRKFESYLTGYPLPGKRYYALARTWYAPEMPRPGCVWTQTLLLALPLLTRMHNLSELNNLFERPQVGLVDTYSVAIPAENFIHNIPNSLYNTRPSFQTIAYYLYSKTKDAVIIPAEATAEYEEDILSIWTQQWPRLRRSFSFCTGSLSIRELDDKPLDCQVVPESYGSRLSRQHTDNINIVDLSAKNRATHWFELYKGIQPQRLQEFMYKYGSDVIGKRSKFAPLCFAYTILHNEQERIISFDSLLSFFKQYFSSVSEAKRLKRDLISELIEATPDGEYEFIKTLLTSPNTDVIPAQERDFSEQIIQLWSEKRISSDRITKLLAELDTSRLNESQKLKLLSGLPVKIWLDIRWVTDDLLAEIITTHPHILEQSDFWHSTISNQRIGLELFTKNSSNYLRIKNIVSAMLDAQNDRWVDTLSSTFGSLVLLTVLDWLIYKPNVVLPRKWEELVWVYPSEFMFWLAANQHYTERNIELMLQIFVAKSFRADNLDDEDTKALLNQLVKVRPSSRRNQAMAIWLAKGLSNSHPIAKDITVILFQPIYDIAKQGELDNVSWQILAPSYERTRETYGVVSFFNWLLSESKPQPEYWDKCGQLRQKIVESSILFKWPSEIICKAISNKDAFEKTMGYTLQFASGVEFFGKVYRFIQNSKVYKNSFHATVMKSEYEKTKKGKMRRK